MKSLSKRDWQFLDVKSCKKYMWNPTGVTRCRLKSRTSARKRKRARAGAIERFYMRTDIIFFSRSDITSPDIDWRHFMSRSSREKSRESARRSFWRVSNLSKIHYDINVILEIVSVTRCHEKLQHVTKSYNMLRKVTKRRWKARGYAGSRQRRAIERIMMQNHV